jgi:hypothetical protein
MHARLAGKNYSLPKAFLDVLDVRLLMESLGNIGNCSIILQFTVLAI